MLTLEIRFSWLPGEYTISRIYYIKRSGNAKAPILIQGAGIGKTTIIPLYTKAFRVFGHYIQFKNLTFRGRGGGVPFEAMGNHITVEWCSFEENNVGLDISVIIFGAAFVYLLK
ncbi:MAG: hypothetical protein R3B93_03340 [Bacteroidia bacterium]